MTEPNFPIPNPYEPHQAESNPAESNLRFDSVRFGGVQFGFGSAGFGSVRCGSVGFGIGKFGSVTNSDEHLYERVLFEILYDLYFQVTNLKRKKIETSIKKTNKRGDKLFLE